ncbi:MAG: hypothetical protein CTY15_03700 [Methylocystis sp.]|nr:MAG: hypothetical protein CTY15_03700 [Methylocystis sp.]
MMNGLVNYGATRVLGLGVVGVGLGVFYVVDQYDKKNNYTPIQARVSRVEEKCYMEKRSGRSTWTSDMLACERAQEMVKSHPNWLGYTVKYKINVSYDYVSPVDNRTHSGSRVMSAYPDGKKIYPGSQISIRASKSDPNKTRES